MIIYKNQKIFLKRKHDLFLKFFEYKKIVKKGRYANNDIRLAEFETRSNF